MSPRFPVPSLRVSALHVLANAVVSAVTLVHVEGNLDDWDTWEVYEDELGSITNLLSVAPGNLKEEMLHNVLATEELDPAIRSSLASLTNLPLLEIHHVALGIHVPLWWRFGVMRLLLHEHVRTLIVGTFPQDYYSRILDIIAEKGNGLHVLDLRGIWAKEGEEAALLASVLEQLTNLRELHAPHVGSDSVLQALHSSRDQLMVLDVSGECGITHIGLNSLCTLCKRIQVLSIGSPGAENVAPADIALALQELPELLTLGAYSYVGKALLHLLGQDKSPGQLRLQYLHDTGTDVGTLDAILQLCPVLESIYVEHPENGVISRLHLIPNLKQVKLNKLDCSSGTEFDGFLNHIGEPLESLELLLGRGVLDVSSIAARCPNLGRLTCYKLDFITHFENVDFPHLKKLELLHSPISTSCVRYLMSSCPILEELSVGESIDLTDDDLAAILAKTILPELRELWLPIARNLSHISVEMLMITCPKLRSIGILSGWALTPDDVQELLYEIQISNMDLVLWEFFTD